MTTTTALPPSPLESQTRACKSPRFTFPTAPSSPVPATITIAVAAGVVALSLPSGGYGVEARSLFGIAVWWLIMLLALFAPAASVHRTRLAVVAGASLVALGLLTGLSALWAANREDAFLEFDRVAIYTGLYLATVILCRREYLRPTINGLAIGIVAVAILALVSRCLPGILNENPFGTLLPAVATRLSYPLEYWNALAIFAALGAPVLVARATEDRPRWIRGLWLAPLPALGATIYLTSSRGGVAVAIVALVVVVASLRRRLGATLAIAVGALGIGAAVWILRSRPELVNGPLGSGRARSEGIAAAGLIATACLATGVLYGLLAHGRVLRARMQRRLAAVTAVTGIAGIALGVALAHPVRRFNTFKAPPPQSTHAVADFINVHLLSGTGSGRWQFWSAALRQFGANPILGQGAGSYQAWWYQHGTIFYVLRNAHSLYLETFGELGVVGGILPIVALGCGVVGGVTRLRRRSMETTTGAAGLAIFVGFLVGAGIDWLWQITVVAAAGIVVLALLTGPASAFSPELPVMLRPPIRTSRAGALGRLPWRLAGRVAIGLLAACVIAAQALPWLVQNEVRASQAAARRGDLRLAVARALSARTLEPWAESPYLQLALVDEQAGDYSDARVAIVQATRRSRDWQAWLIAARIDNEAGAARQAQRSLAEARRLNPHSPLFHS